MGLFFKKRHIKTWNIYAVIYEFNENISSPLTLSYIITWKTPSSSCKIWYFGNLEPWEKKQLHSFPLWGHKDISYIIFRNKISVYIILLFWFLLNWCVGFVYDFFSSVFCRRFHCFTRFDTLPHAAFEYSFLFGLVSAPRCWFIFVRETLSREPAWRLPAEICCSDGSWFHGEHRSAPPP